MHSTMNDSNPNEDASSMQPAYLRAIDVALSHRNEMADVLDLIAGESLGKVDAIQTKHFAQSLRKGLTTESLISNPKYAVWIPLVIQGWRDGAKTLAKNKDTSRSIEDLAIASLRDRLPLLPLTYPIVLLVVFLSLILSISFALVPSFEAMFQDFGLKLPVPTQVLFWMCKQISGHPLRTASLGGIIVLGFIMLVWLRPMWTRYAHSTRSLGGLTMGSRSDLLGMSQLTLTLAELLDVQATLPDALRIAGTASQHGTLARVSSSMSTLSTTKNSLTQLLNIVPSFPPIVLMALVSGPDRSPDTGLLRQLSLLYRDRARGRAALWSRVATPITILMFGLIVGFTVIALFLPLISLIRSLSS